MSYIKEWLFWKLWDWWRKKQDSDRLESFRTWLDFDIREAKKQERDAKINEVIEYLDKL